MGDHIYTAETPFVNALDIGVQHCPFCFKDTPHEAGYTANRCKSCRAVYDPFELWLGELAKRYREKFKKTRRQWAELTGYSAKTIKQYEWVKCTKAYFTKCEAVYRDLLEASHD